MANGDSVKLDQTVVLRRFGVTSEYLVSADELQIKMAQGPSRARAVSSGHKVYPWIAKVRYSTPRRRPDLTAATTTSTRSRISRN